MFSRRRMLITGTALILAGRAASAETPEGFAVTRSEDERMISRAASLLVSMLQSEEDTAKFKGQWRDDLDALAGDSPEARRARIAFWAVEGLFLLRGLGIMRIDSDEWERSLDDLRDMYLGKL